MINPPLKSVAPPFYRDCVAWWQPSLRGLSTSAGEVDAVLPLDGNTTYRLQDKNSSYKPTTVNIFRKNRLGIRATEGYGLDPDNSLQISGDFHIVLAISLDCIYLNMPFMPYDDFLTEFIFEDGDVAFYSGASRLALTNSSPVGYNGEHSVVEISRNGSNEWNVVVNGTDVTSNTATSLTSDIRWTVGDGFPNYVLGTNEGVTWAAIGFWDSQQTSGYMDNVREYLYRELIDTTAVDLI